MLRTAIHSIFFFCKCVLCVIGNYDVSFIWLSVLGSEERQRKEKQFTLVFSIVKCWEPIQDYPFASFLPLFPLHCFGIYVTSFLQFYTWGILHIFLFVKTLFALRQILLQCCSVHCSFLIQCTFCSSFHYPGFPSPLSTCWCYWHTERDWWQMTLRTCFSHLLFSRESVLLSILRGRL